VEQHEILAPVPVFKDGGSPVNFGWARQPCLYQYEPTLARIPFRLQTRGDRYIVFSPTWIFSFEAQDGGWWAGVRLTAVSIRDRRIASHFIDMPFSDVGESGGLRLSRKKNQFDFLIRPSGARIIRADIPQFTNRVSLRCEFVLTRRFPTAESLVSLSPWRGKKYAWQFLGRTCGLVVEGVAQLGNSKIVLSRQNAWGIFDWNRSGRPGRDTHYWAAATGMRYGDLCGLTVGFGLAESSTGTENAFFLNGRAHKLSQVTFHITPSDWLLPWRFTSDDNRLEMTFTPLASDIFSMRSFGRYCKTRVFYGFFSGRVKLDDGSDFTFRNLTGVAERRRTLR
jgi:hypothetical protein